MRSLNLSGGQREQGEKLLFAQAIALQALNKALRKLVKGRLILPLGKPLSAPFYIFWRSALLRLKEPIAK